MKASMSGRIHLLPLATLTLIVALVTVHPLSADGPIRVGIYPNEPLVFVDAEGQPAGFYIDLLEATATEEGWTLEYVECLFPDCLTLLEQGDLDLMTAIAYSEERGRRFDFNQETVLANWGQVYTREDGPQSIPDLEGQTIAVVQDDIYYTRFRDLVEAFDISCQFTEVEDYGPVLEEVAAGEVDAGLVARLYGMRHEREYNVVRSPILCCPSELRFAAPEGRNADLLNAIDRHIASWKENPNSLYYAALDHWFEGAITRPKPLEQVPGWIIWAIVAMAGVAILALAFDLLLRAQVRARTRELQEAEESVRRQVVALKEERERLALLHRLGQHLSASLDVHEVAQRALDDICAVVGALRGIILLWDASEQHLRPAAVSGYDTESLASLARRLPLLLDESSLAGWVAAHRSPAIVTDVTDDPRWKPVSGLDDWVCSALSVPLVSREELVGVMSVYSDREGFFNEGHREIAESAAATVAAAVHNASLYEEARQRALEEETLREAALALSTVRDPEAAVEQILAELERVVPYDSASVQWLEGNLLRIVGGRGFDNLESLLGITFDITRDDNPNRQVVETRAPLIIDNAPEVYAGFRQEPHAPAGIRSWLGVPMVVGERLIGMIALDKREAGFYTEAHARLAEGFATQAAVVLENARLYEATQKRARQLALVAQVAGQVGSILDPERLLQAVVEQVVEAFGYDYVAIMLLDPETDELVFTVWAGALAARTPPGFRQKVGDGMAGQAAYLGETILANDVSQEPRYIAPFLYETQSELDVPLKRGERVIGVLNIQNRRLNAFDAQDVQAMEALAGHIATAIENARLHAQLQAYAEGLEQRVEERTTELRREQERTQAILDAAGEGVFVTDVDGRIEYMNPAAEEMTGYRLEELRGQRLWERAADQEQTERMRPMAEALRREEAWRGEARLRRKDNFIFDAALIVAPIPGEKGPYGYVAIVEDITPIRELERTKSQFITNISHEFRTPLATAKLYAELARRQPDRQARSLHALDAELDHLTALVEDILEVARIDAGRLDLQPRVISLNDLVTSAVERHQPLAEEKGLHIERHLAEAEPVVKVDPQRIEQVLDNLLGNAIRYTPSGGRIAVSTGTTETEGRPWATFTVSDTGIGIPEDELPHIFERFFRGKEPRRMQVSGTGLGLSIVKEIVERHCGFVTVESEGGKGSAFTVWLPL